MKIDDIAKQLANKVNQEHYIRQYLEKVQRGAYNKGVKDAEAKQLNLCGVSNWVRFEDDKPKLNDRYLIVWDNYPPETRTWQKEDENKDYSGLRWLAIPKWK